MLRELVEKSRSYRRFDQNFAIAAEELREFVELARLSPSAANLQPLKFIISSTPKSNAKIFPCTAWAGYIEHWPGPAEGERPSAYIIILGDKEVATGFGCDHGIAAQIIMLGAAEKGLGGCIIGSVARGKLAKALNLDTRYEILLVLALGKPIENVQIEEVARKGNIKYWRDENGVHHVPKRALADIVIQEL